MRRSIAGGVAAWCAVLAFSASAFAWGPATHAWVDDNLGKKAGPQNNGEMYGGIAADFFNFNFSDPAANLFVYDATHTGFMQVWDARTNRTKPFAVGFVSHNGVWGADRTAHSESATPAYPNGYVIGKATLMMQAIRAEGATNPLAQYPDPLLLEICHNFVEYGIEMLVRQIDPLIGYKIVAAATFRPPDVPKLLAEAYAGGLSAFTLQNPGSPDLTVEEAGAILRATEERFRQDMILYGAALLQDETRMLDYLARRLGEAAAAFLAANGAEVPDGIDLVQVITSGIVAGKNLCAADLRPELKATVRLVAKELAKHDVR